MTEPAIRSPRTTARSRPDFAVWSIFCILFSVALADVFVSGHPARRWYDLLAVMALGAAAAALIIAIRWGRGGARTADAFFPLVLLNPLLYHPRITSNIPLGIDRTLVTTGLLGLIAGAIIAMRRDNLLRYLAVAALTLVLALLADSFLLIVPALVAWFVSAGFILARSDKPRLRTHGIVIMTLGEVGLLLFGVATILEQSAATPLNADFFSKIVNFVDFPLLVVAILMLALGWRKSPGGKTPPHFAGMLALLMGLLTLLLNNFQSGFLPEPGTDQTVMLLCLVYTVFALHGPRRLQWLVPPALLLAAMAYTVKIGGML